MELVINGEHHSVLAGSSDRQLLFVLRDELGLTGAKYGCGEGQCGACTVLLDGVAKRSCMTPLSAAVGKAVTTIEGVADGDRLHPVQHSFMECDAMQCGYCTSGMILSSVALLHRNHAPTELEIRQALEGNLCRCGTYSRIVAAVRMASQLLAGGTKGGAHA